jgi:hypothetical protein
MTVSARGDKIYLHAEGALFKKNAVFKKAVSS